jgi:subtilase family serine protease
MSRSSFSPAWRHRAATLVGLATLAAGAATGVTTTASAAPSAAAQMHSARVCAHQPVGYAACTAWVRTDGHGKPQVTSTPAGYSASQLQTAYGVSGLSSSATVAIVDAYANPNAASDLAAYRTAMGLGPANLTQVNQSGGSISTVAGNTSWGQEEMLDLEMVSAICPTCKILYVGANSAGMTDLGTAVNRAVSLGAGAVSNSYGGSESRSELSWDTYYNHPGVAITVSSGDSGYGVEYPAASQYVTAVGGTTLTLNSGGTRASETVWSGAGSGCSAYEGKPSWQHDTACARRTVADVAADANPNTGVAVYDTYGSSGWLVFGGTSVASPIIASVYALSGNTAGTPAQLAYSAPSGSLFDVTSGSNGRCTSRRSTAGAYLCTGEVGYDGPTGNGTPNGTGAF